ncbi:MAG: hypothetical protein FJZ43_02675 [Candidatus Staskawiczbacteria bacterium]|nr:hypothetical protein [Candidatus Staskawiczbacteria bacterium]
MEKINYLQTYQKFTKGLSKKVKDIFDRRFGVKSGQVETLESIGKSLGITRERVRQIEEAGFNHVKKNHKDSLYVIFTEFGSYFAKKGGFKKEDLVLEELAGKKNKPYVLFLLTLGGDRFKRVSAKKDFHYFWLANPASDKQVKDTLENIVKDIDSQKQLLDKNQMISTFASKHNISQEAVASYIEISKKIQESKDGKLGLITWPEIKPRGVRDKAFLVFKKEKKPLHFRLIAQLIDGLGYNGEDKKAHPQTVHNELIKDTRFVLVGRGTYALAEWGYVPGTIKDIITKVLKDKQEAVHQEDLVKEVLAQRIVAKNTVLINLNNKKFFSKNEDGKYILRETQLS